MVKPEEQRIGNYLQWSSIASMGTGVFQIKKGADIDSYNSLKEPIELTEEWLFKFGFTKHKLNVGIHYKRNRHFVYLFDDGTFEFEFSPQDGKRYNLFKIYAGVHQLQNLWFGLMKEDLQINQQ